MSLKDDLLRNRAIFQKLTGESADSSGATIKPISISDIIPSDDTEQRPPLKIPGYNEPPETPHTVFSLKYGHVAPSFGFEPPDTVSYPSLSDKKQVMAQDPLENLYYQLEVDARRSSQLTSEEEFYG